jgi:hypothetical protein
MRSAILFRMLARSAGEVLPQASLAAWAASSASSTSSLLERATSQKGWPVIGVTFGKYSPLTGATKRRRCSCRSAAERIGDAEFADVREIHVILFLLVMWPLQATVCREHRCTFASAVPARFPAWPRHGPNPLRRPFLVHLCQTGTTAQRITTPQGSWPTGYRRPWRRPRCRSPTRCPSGHWPRTGGLPSGVSAMFQGRLPTAMVALTLYCAPDRSPSRCRRCPVRHIHLPAVGRDGDAGRVLPAGMVATARRARPCRHVHGPGQFAGDIGPLPSGVKPMPRGRRPTAIEPTWRRAATSITSTCSAFSAETSSQRPSGLNTACSGLHALDLDLGQNAVRWRRPRPRCCSPRPPPRPSARRVDTLTPSGDLPTGSLAMVRRWRHRAPAARCRRHR